MKMKRNDRDLETLLDSAYDHVHPSPAVEDAIADELNEERPRRAPRIVPLWAVATAASIGGLLIAVLALRNVTSDDPTTALLGDGPDVPQIDPLLGVVDSPKTIRVRLRTGGRIEVPLAELGGKWMRVSLADFATYLKAGVKRHAPNAKKGRPVPSIRVVFEVDKNAPWRHVQWLMFACAESYLPTIKLKVGNPGGGSQLLDASLPIDLGMLDGLEEEIEIPEEEIEEHPIETEVIEDDPVAKDPETNETPPVAKDPKVTEAAPDESFPVKKRPDLEAEVAITGERRKALEALGKLRAARRPQNTIKVHIAIGYEGAAVVYRFGDRRPSDFASAAAWIRDARRAAAGGAPRVALVGEIKASAITPYRVVVQLLAEFRRQGVQRVQFYGTALPSKAVRDGKTLPPPVMGGRRR
ncbi:MAG: hypothetical protein OER88_11865 [Planctomycetota bacterium]|nr:hypothetical protein [Planctomycetota bacterium]